MAQRKPTAESTVPRPVPKGPLVCSVCDLEWDRHGEHTLVGCVILLKDELRKRPNFTTINNYPTTGNPVGSWHGTAIAAS